MQFEAGISEAVWPYTVRWTGDIVEAQTPNEAEDLFGDKGYYRNLRTREVPSV